MKILGVDTSSDICSVCLLEDNNIIKELHLNNGKTHSENLVPLLKELMDSCNITFNDINLIAINKGPGSFTGVRIGLTIAKIYGYLLKKDIITVSSLRAMALSSDAKIVIPIIDAHHDNYYYGVYDMFDNIILKDNFNTKEELLKQINKYEEADIVSNETVNNGEIKARKIEYDIVNIVNHYKYELPVNPHLVVPNYLKLPQALEENK